MDRQGNILADNLTTTSLILIPNQIKNKVSTAKKLAEILKLNIQELEIK